MFEGGLHEAYKDNLSGGPGNDWVAPLNDPAYADVLTCGSGWVAGVPLALGSALGAYVAARLATKAWTRVWVYRFLVFAVVLSRGYLIMTDSGDCLQFV